MPAVGAVLADPAQPGFGVFNTVNLTSQGDRTVSIKPLFVLDPPPAPPVFPPKFRGCSLRNNGGVNYGIMGV